MSRFANRLTQTLEPYVPGEQPREQGLIKLNTNENPYGPGPEVKKALAAFNADDLRLYPDPESVKLRTLLGEKHGLRPEQVFVGNGSDEILGFVFQTFFEPDGEPLLFPELTYSFYEVYAKRYGIPYEKIPLGEADEARPEDYNRPGQAVILANPNAPTGRVLSPEEILELCRQKEDRLVVADEAYIDFAPEGFSAADLAGEVKNLLVVQTFSKSRSLAGLRVGMAFGSEELIADLLKQKNCFNSYPLDRLAQTLAEASLREDGYYLHTAAKIRQTRDRIVPELQALGFDVTPSAANYLWIRHKKLSGEYIYKGLRSRRILARYWPKPGLSEHLRVTVGTDEEMDIFLRAAADIVQYNDGEAGIS